jgi:septal ring factor EnvC (AmiA/AmiB activator)
MLLQLNIRKIGVLLALIGLSNMTFAQSTKAKLQKSKQEALKEIEYANELLNETKGKAVESINKISIIEHKLGKQKQILLTMEIEMNYLSAAIDDNLRSIEKLQNQIGRIKSLYRKLILNSYKFRDRNYLLMYLFASDNFNQLYKRIRMIKVYRSFLKNQVRSLISLQRFVNERNFELMKLKESKSVLLRKTKREEITLLNNINEKQELVLKLKKRQKELEEKIKEKERVAERIEKELKKIITDTKSLKSKSEGMILITPEEKIISNDFLKNEGRLPWPTEKGIISGNYGEHSHPDFQGVKIRNDGIYISTNCGSKARCVFNGLVTKVFSIPGQNFTVMIKHGEFYSLYHNLIHVIVKAGQVVNTKDYLGTIYTDEITRETVLYFMIWRGTEKLNPEIWLTK